MIKDDKHYAAIASKVSTSIPQIRRDFTARFKHGKEYLDAAERKFDQPTHHARRILMLTDLYDDETLDRFIAYSIGHGKMRITEFKELLKAYNAGEIELPDDGSASEKAQAATDGDAYRDDDPDLTRDCNYYEEYAMTEVTR